MIINFIEGGGGASSEELIGLIDRSITSMNIPEGVDTIGNSAFYGCAELTGVTIPESVTFIDSDAFCECSALKTVTFKGETAPSVEDGAFGGSDDDITVNTPEGSDYSSVITNIIGEEPILKIVRTNSTVDNIKCPYGIFKPNNKYIGDNSIKEVDMTSISSINRGNAFQNCHSLEKVIIGSEFTAIPEWTFIGSENLSYIESLAVTAPTLGEGALGALSATGTLKIPEGATGYDAWINELGEGWTIEQPTSASVKVTYNDGTERTFNFSDGKIPDSYFNDDENRDNMTDVVIGAGITEIGVAIGLGSAVTAITIGPDVELIQPYAFIGLDVHTVTFQGMTAPTDGGETFRYDGERYVGTMYINEGATGYDAWKNTYFPTWSLEYIGEGGGCEPEEIEFENGIRQFVEGVDFNWGETTSGGYAYVNTPTAYLPKYCAIGFGYDGCDFIFNEEGGAEFFANDNNGSYNAETDKWNIYVDETGEDIVTDCLWSVNDYIYPFEMCYVKINGQVYIEINNAEGENLAFGEPEVVYREAENSVAEGLVEVTLSDGVIQTGGDTGTLDNDFLFVPLMNTPNSGIEVYLNNEDDEDELYIGFGSDGKLSSATLDHYDGDGDLKWRTGFNATTKQWGEESKVKTTYNFMGIYNVNGTDMFVINYTRHNKAVYGISSVYLNNGAKAYVAQGSVVGYGEDNDFGNRIFTSSDGILHNQTGWAFLRFDTYADNIEGTALNNVMIEVYFKANPTTIAGNAFGENGYDGMLTSIYYPWDKATWGVLKRSTDGQGYNWFDMVPCGVSPDCRIHCTDGDIFLE